MKYFACAAALLIGAGTAYGQEANPDKPAPPSGASTSTDASAEAEDLIATGAEGDTGFRWPKIWFQFDLAPEIAQQDPFSGDSRNSDSTEVRWTLGLKETIGDLINVDLRLGPAATIDTDRDSSAKSRFGGSLTLRTVTLLDNTPSEESGRPAPRVAFSLNSFFAYGLALNYTDFFNDRNGTDHTLDGGIGLQLKFPLTRHGGGEASADLGPRRVESTLPLSDYTSFRIVPKVRLPLFRDVAIVASVEAERRWYDDINPSIGRARRDWRFQGFLGADFAGLINRCLGMELVNEATIGARLIDVDSNVASEDRSTLKFAASLRISVPLTYSMGRVEQSQSCA